jgi:ABC-type sugar transport system ATPase subunit
MEHNMHDDHMNSQSLKPTTLSEAVRTIPNINQFVSMVWTDPSCPWMTFGDRNIPLDKKFTKHVSRRLVMAVEPEAVIPTRPKSSNINARVMSVTPMDDRLLVSLQAPHGTKTQDIWASVRPSKSQPMVGEFMRVRFLPSGTHFFDAETGQRVED